MKFKYISIGLQTQMDMHKIAVCLETNSGRCCILLLYHSHLKKKACVFFCNQIGNILY